MGKVIKFESKAWASSKYTLEAVLNGDTELVALSNAEMKQHGWIQVGVAVVEMTLRSPEELLGSQVDAIKAEIESERAAHQERINFLQGELQSLLALPNEVPA